VRFAFTRAAQKADSPAQFLLSLALTETEPRMYNEAEIFRELAPLLQVRPELKQICRYGAQWGSEHEPEAAGWAPFHIVTFGECLLDVGNRVGIPLKAGDAAALPHGGPHTIRAHPASMGSASILRVHRRLYDELPVNSNVDGEPDTKLFAVVCASSRLTII
jgi:hypothetical protein